MVRMRFLGGAIAFGWLGVVPAVAQVATPVPASTPSVPGRADPSSPLDPMPDIGVAWPDLGVRDAIEGQPDARGATIADAAAAQRYGVTVEGLELIGPVRAQFDAASALRDGAGKPANAAQLSVRAKDDVALMKALLRSAGYYNATVTSELKPVGDTLAVTLTVAPGPLYRFDEVRVTGLDAPAPTGEAALGLTPAAPIEAAKVIEGEAALRERLGNSGYPFARVPESTVTIDHRDAKGDLALTVETGGKRTIADIRVAGDNAPFDADHTAVIARFKPGELYNQAMVDDLRRALIATGIVALARVEPVENGPDKVDVVATIEPAPMRTLAGEIGYGTGEGFRIAGSWQHRNLIRPEGAVTLRGVAGTREQALGATLRMGNFRARDVVLNARVIASRTRYPAYDANTFEVAANIERLSTILWQKRWTYSAGIELLASDERDFVPLDGMPGRRTYFIAAVPATIAYDGSDSLLDPTTGFRAALRLSPETSLRGNVSTYVRAQADGSAYVPFGDTVVVAGRVRIASIAGADIAAVAPSRRYYGGGGGSVRGFGYQALGPRDIRGIPIGGRSLAELSLEARIRLGLFGGNFGVVPFVDAGNVYTAQFPTFDGLRFGAGLGLRYYSSFGPLRFDIGTPIARRPGESIVAVYVSLGQAF